MHVHQIINSSDSPASSLKHFPSYISFHPANDNIPFKTRPHGPKRLLESFKNINADILKMHNDFFILSWWFKKPFSLVISEIFGG